jgi:hypothetical protein
MSEDDIINHAHAEMAKRLKTEGYRDPRIQRVCTHPRGLWWVSYDHATGRYSLVDAWKGEVATSNNSEALVASVRLLTGFESWLICGP